MKPVAILLALVLTAGAALSQPVDRPMRHAEKAPMAGRMEMMQKLNLTEEQQTQMRKLHVEFQKKQIQNQAKIRLARLDLAQLIQADKPDRSAIEKAVRDFSAIETDSKLARVDHMMGVRAILTPEQQKMMKEQMMNRGSQMREHMRMFRRQDMGLLREDMAPPAFDMPDMMSMSDLMDVPEPIMDEEDVTVE